MLTEAAVGVGIVAPVGLVLVLAVVFGGWQGAAELRQRDAERDEIRERAKEEASLLRREALLRRERDIRLGRLNSDDERFVPRDEGESVRVVPPESAANDE